MNNFYQPNNEKELVEVLKLKDENTILLAGATDVMVEMKQKRIFDKDFIDLTKISEFNFIKEFDDNVQIGSITKIQDIADNDIIKDNFHSLATATRHVGSKQIRNRATIGGNVANASQSADTLPVLFSLNALCEVINSNGIKRTLKVDDLIIGRGKTNLEKDEAITKIIIPKTSKYNYFSKLGSRKEVTISKINCGSLFILKDFQIEKSHIYIGAIGIKAINAIELEQYFNGKNIRQIEDEQIRKIGFDIVEKAIPNRESKYYKRQAIYGILSDILEELRHDNGI
ncbi:MAG: FAD binding domain-containing protein [Peptoanaerobacter stomatis]|uniref:FAD binding domain-containing protein n=1 Tax=Peptoanaerobacter stomatis TaxID=796937 RepID=UPI003F9FE887